MTVPTASISARPVAAGISGDKVRIVLVLMPVNGTEVALDRWPCAIEEKLAVEGAWNLQVVPAERRADGGRPSPPADRAALRSVQLAGAKIHAYGSAPAAHGRRELVDEALDLWRWVMGEGATGVDGQFVWDGIKETIANAATYSEPKPLQVAAVRRADAALYYTVARARSLFKRDRTARPVPSKVPPFAAPNPPDPNPIKAKANADAAKAKADKDAADAMVADGRTDPEVVKALAATISLGTAQAEVRRRFRSKDAKLSDLLGAMADPTGYGPMPSTPGEVLGAALDGDHDDPLASDLRALHVAMTLDDVDKSAGGKTTRADGVTLRNFAQDSTEAAKLGEPQRAPQLLFALRANPTLGRLFRFVVDVEVPVQALVAAAGGKPAGPGSEERFVFLAASFGSAVAPVWVVTKLSFAGGVLTQAWPALRAEMDLAVAASSDAAAADLDRARRLSVTQSNGLLHLGQGLDGAAPWSRHARYDLATADAAFAVDSDVRRSKLRQSLVDNAARQGSDVDPAALAAVPGPSIISRGLVVLDRWRQSAVVGEITTAAAFCASCGGSDPVVVDAEDMATGLAVHVAGPIGDVLSWRSQMDRRIAYADPRKKGNVDVEALLAALGVGSDSPWRLQSDGASVSIPSRNRETDGAPVIHVEEGVCSMEGDPLALSCKSEVGVAITAGADLAIDRVYSLATTGGARPVPLRIGWLYKVGAGPIWAGGVSVPIERASAVLDGDPSLTLPSVSPALSKAVAAKTLLAVRRFLRHEAIRPPSVLLPLYLAVREDDRVRQTGPIVILREGVPADRSSWRLVVPAHTSLDDAWRHGAFDNDPAPIGPAAGRPPRDGLAAVDWDEPWGGFPVYGRPSSDATPTRAGLTKLASNPKKRPTQKGTLPPPPDDAGQPVFQTRRRGSVRPMPFYPDPAGEELVIALRPVAATEQGDGGLVRSRDSKPYFAGVPSVIPLRPAAADFRDALPVAVEFQRVDSHRSDAPTQESLFVALEPGRRHADRYCDGRTDRLGRVQSGTDARVLAIRIGLRKGEHVAADCWLAPTEAKLRGWFDLPETLAMLADVNFDDSDDKVFAGIEAAIGLDDGFLSRAASGLNRSRPRRWLSSSGLPVRERVVAALARYLSEELRRKPIPQLSAVLTIEAVHAVGEPRAPLFPLVSTGLRDDATASSDASQQSPEQARQSRKALDLTRYDIAGGATKRLDLLKAYQQNGKWTEDTPQGATGTLLAGDVLVDRDASSDLEVVALCVSPQSARMDDPDRKRTDQQRIEGVWPKTRRGPAGGSMPEERLERSLEVFGFSIDPDGAVTLPRVEVTLLRLDGFGSRADGPISDDGLDVMALADEHVKALSQASAVLTMPVADAPRVTTFDPFKDRLARRLLLGLRASSRYLPLLEPVVASQDGLAIPRSSPAAARTQVDAGSTVAVWLPATQRPSAPAVHAALPLPAQSGRDDPEVGGCSSRTRTCSVRVWLERPWFSSGEGERLGLVVWPPRTGKLAEDALLKGLVERPKPPGSAPEEPGDQAYMAMAAFTDDDLGPGGKFVTRWGADPIKTASGPDGPFIPASALVDLDKSLQAALLDMTLPAEDRARLVEDIQARLIDPADASIGYAAAVPMPTFPDGADDRDGAPAATLTVDLITYVPKFDPDSERWFVDVKVEPRAPQDLIEPLVRLGLVRFQAHALAKPDLRTSAPAVTWVPILPPREAFVWRETAAGPIVIQVSGPIASRLDREKRMREPRLRVALLAEMTLASGITVATIVPQRDDDGHGPGSEPDGWVTVARGSPQRQSAASGGAWVRRLQDHGSLHDEQGVARRLFVLVEELEEFPSSDNEPVVDAASPPNASPSWQIAKPGERVGGPRFAAKLAVPPSAPPSSRQHASPVPDGALGREARSRPGGAEASRPDTPDHSILSRRY